MRGGKAKLHQLLEDSPRRLFESPFVVSGVGSSGKGLRDGKVSMWGPFLDTNLGVYPVPETVVGKSLVDVKERRSSREECTCDSLRGTKTKHSKKTTKMVRRPHTTPRGAEPALSVIPCNAWDGSNRRLPDIIVRRLYLYGGVS